MGANQTLQAIRKPQIVEATLRLMSDRGSHQVTLDDVAKAAGLSKGGLIHYYPSKEALFKDAVQAFFDRIFQRARETMDQFRDPLAKILSFMWLFNADELDIEIGYPLLFDFMALSAQNPDYQKVFHDWVSNWITLLSEALEEGVAAGRFQLEDIDGMARTISALYQGVATRWYLDRESHSAAWVDQAVRGTIVKLLAKT